LHLGYLDLILTKCISVPMPCPVWKRKFCDMSKGVCFPAFYHPIMNSDPTNSARVVDTSSLHNL
jgi:hypothetical protein